MDSRLKMSGMTEGRSEHVGDDREAIENIGHDRGVIENTGHDGGRLNTSGMTEGPALAPLSAPSVIPAGV